MGEKINVLYRAKTIASDFIFEHPVPNYKNGKVIFKKDGLYLVTSSEQVKICL